MSCSSSRGIYNALRTEFIRTLEVSTSKNGPWSLLPGQQDAATNLFERGFFQAGVQPDLPSVVKLIDLFNPEIFRRDSNKNEETGSSPNGLSDVCSFPVRTVAAQVQSLSTVEEKIKENGSSLKNGALLFVSGGHPLRRLPFLSAFMPTNSEAMLRLAHKLRREGDLPQDVQFWAVENPLVNSVSRLRQKIEAGAEAIITQPPLLPETFQLWWEEVVSLGLQKDVPIIVGVPVLSSANNFAFWLHLTGAASVGSESERVLRGLRASEANYKEGKQLFWREYNAAMIRQVESLPGVAGMHVMPVTARGWRELPHLCESFGSHGTEKQSSRGG